MRPNRMIIKRRIGRRWGLALLLCLLAAVCLPGKVGAEDAQLSVKQGVNVVKLAKRTTLPEGKLIRSGGKIMYRKTDGTLLTDTWVRYATSIYHFDADGSAWTGSKSFAGNRYYFDKQGRLYVRKLHKAGSARYYYGPNGAMVRNQWVRRGENRYYFLENGQMARSRWAKGCYFKSNGLIDFTKGKLKTGIFKQAKKGQKLIIVGASRVHQMKLAVGKKANVTYIAQSGATVSWFGSTAVRQLKRLLHSAPNSKVVIQMGNNDLRQGNSSGNFKRYQLLYRGLIRSYPRARFYLMDILPCKPERSKINRMAEDFNAALKKAFPHQYIGGYEYLVEHGFSTSYNRRHYTPDTSRAIFNYILRKVG